MPKISNESSSLRLPQLTMLRALASGGAMTRAKIASATGLSGTPDDLGLTPVLVSKQVIEIEEGQKEMIFRLLPAGKAALAKAGGNGGKAATNGRLVKPKIGALVPWFGGARQVSAEIGSALDGCSFVAVAFGGSLSELPHIKASSMAVNDLHRHVINLARVAADSRLGPQLYRRLRKLLFHPDEFKEMQKEAELWVGSAKGRDYPDLNAAVAYFASQWMGRSGKSGTDGEFKGSLSTRWNSNGGDSALRFRQAAFGLRDWRRILQRCSFACLDWREFLGKIKDDPKTTIYCDPPWPGLGSAYKHGFSDDDHAELAATLLEWNQARVVVRILDCPLIRKLYPAELWQWQTFASRNSGNAAVAEALLRKL